MGSQWLLDLVSKEASKNKAKTDASENLQSIKLQRMELRPNHSYDLNGIVVHYGSGLHYGHYWSLSKTQAPNSKWLEFDDTKIRVVEDREI